MRIRKNKAPRKKRRLKYIAVLPSLITLMNGVCGFVAIYYASSGQEIRPNFFFLMRRAQSGMTSLALACYLIFLAMIADMLDGSVARLTRTTSSFGGQLDSLCDAISFGIAPAFIMVKLVDFHLDHIRLESHGLLMLLRRGAFFAAILYAMCAVVRLARFNVENEEDEMAHMNFSGLPSPGAAGVIAGIIVLHQHLMMVTNVLSQRFRILELIAVSVFPVITLLTGILMVSRVRYPHAPNQLLRGKKTLPTLLVIFAAGLFAVWNIQLALVIGFCGYALYGVIRWIITAVFKKPRPGTPAEADRLINETQAAGRLENADPPNT